MFHINCINTWFTGYWSWYEERRNDRKSRNYC